MYTQLLSKNKAFVRSNRMYIDDYSNHNYNEIDMTISGKCLSEYPNICINMDGLDKYPIYEDIEDLKSAIIEKYNIKFKVIIGSGVNGIIQNLIKIFFQKKGNLVTPFYTFNQAEYATTSMGSITRRVKMNDAYINFDAMLKSINKDTKMIYICNPNNPTGIYVENSEILKFVQKVKNVPIVIDESSIEFSRKRVVIRLL